MNFQREATSISQRMMNFVFFLACLFIFVACHPKTLKRLFGLNFLVKTIAEQIELLEVLIRTKSFTLNANIRLKKRKSRFTQERERHLPEEIFFFRTVSFPSGPP